MERLAELVKAWREHYGWTQQQLAEKAGIEGPNAIGNIERRRHTPQWDKVVKIIHAVGCADDPGRFWHPPGTVIQPNGYTPFKREVVVIDLYKKIPTGNKCSADGKIEILPERLPIPKDRAIALVVDADNGRAMVGVIHEGEELYIDKDKTSPQFGQLIVCVYKKQGLIRFYGRKRGKMILRSTNPFVEDIIVDDPKEVKILGTVVSGYTDYTRVRRR